MKLTHKLTALLSAAAIFCAAAAPVSAADPAVDVKIDSVSIEMEDLSTTGYTIPIYVSLTENPGLTAIEFGLKVDSRCTAKVVTNDAQNPSIISNLTYNQTDELIWIAWASGSLMEETGSLVRIDVTLPDDAAAGDTFTVDYVGEAYVSHQWNDNKENIHYGEMGVSYVDGGISIEGMGEAMKGDVNCDGKVNILDVILLNKSLLAGETITEQGTLNADVDGDGTPTNADSLTILKHTIGLAEL